MNIKKIISIIIVIILSCLCFNTNVYAAQELTCLYEKGYNTLFGGAIAADIDKVVIVQNSSGKVTMYKNTKDADLNGNVSGETNQNYWYVSNDKITYDSSVKKTKKGGYLTSCPKSKTTSGWGTGNVTFYGTEGTSVSDGGDREVLKSSSTKVETVQTQTNYDSLSIKTTKFSSHKSEYKDSSCSSIPDEYKTLADLGNYTLACRYQAAVDKPSKCNIVQINIGGGGVDVYTTDADYGVVRTLKFDGINESEFAKVANSQNSDCPSQIKVQRKKRSSRSTGFNAVYDITVSLSGKGETYLPVGENAAEGKNLTTGDEANKTADFNFNIGFTRIKIASCDDLFSDSSDLKDMIKSLITVIKIIVPIILIVLGSLDFAKGIFSSEEGEIKKAQNKFIKRLIIAVVIFLIPTILKAILTIANSIWPIIDADLCGLI